ncbi:MAG: type II toxin-antitoxin system RelE/ParE family toxin, partial [Treponema sp.]|nr:type II toxin-antitoxin system RelE/ParE family toxin [Treponema sp.]
MRIFKTKASGRDLRKAGLTDTELVTAAEEVNRGEYEADLGGGVIK